MPKARNVVSLPSPQCVRSAMIEDLKGRELFEDVDEAALQSISVCSTICKLEAQERLHPTREAVDYLYVILSGYLTIWIPSRLIYMGDNFLAWRGPEQIIGEMRSIGDEPSDAKIIACEPCELIEIRSDAFTDVANGAPQIYRNIARLLLKKMYHERHRSEVIQMSPSNRKVAQTLLHLARERCLADQFNNAVVEIPGIIHQDEVGAYVGVERETINRSLCTFKRKKIIHYVKSKNGSAITILNRGKLEKIALKLSPRRTRKK